MKYEREGNCNWYLASNILSNHLKPLFLPCKQEEPLAISFITASVTSFYAAALLSAHTLGPSLSTLEGLVGCSLLAQVYLSAPAACPSRPWLLLLVNGPVRRFWPKCANRFEVFPCFAITCFRHFGKRHRHHRQFFHLDQLYYTITS